MKCRLLHETLVVPSEQFPGAWRCRRCGASGAGPPIARCPRCENPIGQRAGRAPAGTELEFPEAWKACRVGAAEPADDECREAMGMTADELAKVRRAYERVRLGIHPEDYEAFDKGLMQGYLPDGSWAPGPNSIRATPGGPLIVEEDEDDDYQEDEDDE